ncbi:MAG: hypothetical protein ACXVA9_05775 [Bdellovibrionales bacterium]
MIELILSQEKKRPQNLSLFFKLNNTEIAREYLHALSLYSRMDDAIFEPDRTHNFPGDKRDCAWIAKEINKCIATINAYTPGLIDGRARAKMPQETLNYLHTYFERYRGSVLEPAEYFKTAPPRVQDALYALNVMIHRYEDVARSENKPASPRIVVSFKAAQRGLLSDEDYKYFTKRDVFGRWYIDYCELGKPLWDLYRDRDDVVGDDNIRPLRYFSANAMVQFSPTKTEKQVRDELDGFYRWWDENKAHLDKLGFKKNDPKNAIGFIPVADLIRTRGVIKNMSQPQILRLMGKYPRIQGVIVHD